MGRGPGRPRLSDVLAVAVASVTEPPTVKQRAINSDEAMVIAKLAMSGADVNDKARKALSYFLTSLTLRSVIDDDDAKVCIDILKQAATSVQKELCNKVLEIYISKFDFAQPGAHSAGKVSQAAAEKESAVAA